MSICLYMDEQVPKAITVGLRQRNVDLLTVQEDNLTGTPDSILLDHATALKRVLFSQDDDFLAEAHYRQAVGIDFFGVIYAHQQNISIGDCVRDLELIAKVCDPSDCANRVQYLPL